MTLSATLADDTAKQALVKDGLQELEAELDDRSGMSGMAIRAGYKTVAKLRPGFIEHNLERLLPRFAPVLDPHIEAGRAAGDVESHLRSNAAPIAEGLLGATDARVAESSNTVANKLYEKLRPKAKENVVSAMPRLARVLARHC